MNSLLKFNTDPFIDSLKAFFEELKVPVDYLADDPASAADILGDRFKTTNDAHQLIADVFALGMVNDAIFEGTATFKNLAQIKKLKVDYDGLLLFGVTLKAGVRPTRSHLAEITRAFNRAFPYTPVTIIFKYGSLISFANSERIPYKQTWREGEKMGKISMLKDIEIEKPHRAHQDIVAELGKHKANNFDELYQYWQKVLNTKELNNKFYQELFKWYLYAKDHVSFPNDNIEEADKYLSESLIRFISRMLFVWFMKEKKLIDQSIFDKNQLQNILKDFDESSVKNTYYKAILQNLFFATLNVPIEERKWIDGKKRNKAQIGDPLIYRYEKEFINSDAVIENIFMKIPFLNGGLFDCLDDREKNIFTDGFTKNEKKQPQFPNYLFFGEQKNTNLSHHFADDVKEIKKWQNQNVSGIIDLLNDYKFTIEENTPLEIDVALDPELLGKVFENLLASFNPETKATARKQTGSFYTPREIVNYMVDESLKAYCTSSFQLEQPASDRKSELHFDPNSEIIIYRKKLPHWQQENVWYFVTFRLADSIPDKKKEEIRREREIWNTNNKNKKEYTKEDWITYNRLFHENTEKLLNSGYGKCLLKKKENADIMANALLHFNNERYILDEWVVMPNHVHVLVKPIGEHYLGDILHSWKSFTANEINKSEDLSGQLWMTESYDHIVRNKQAFNAIKQYIRENPSKANITVPRASSSEHSFEQDARGTDSSEQTFEIEARSTVSELFSVSSHEETSENLRARSAAYVGALFNCKILDPACGSGAYPMGVLHKMVQLMTVLDPKNEHLKEIEGKKLDQLIAGAKNLSDTNARNQTIDALQKQKDILQNAEYDYVRKLYIIENCIYGVDIQPIAIQISKLRFFISLLVEQNKKEDQPNFGIEPLPNMDFKLVAANTLIAPPQEDKGIGLFADHDSFFDDFEQLAHDYFTLHTPESKKAKKHEIIKLINTKIEEKKQQIKRQADVGKKATNIEESVALWESYQNLFKEKAVGFFETPYFFPKVKDGFDVVIGNPPYVRADSPVIADLRKAILDKSQGYETLWEKWDLYVAFIEKGFKFLKQNGIITFIIPDAYMSSKYAEKSHDYFLENGLINRVNFLADVKIFEAAVKNIIIEFKRAKYSNHKPIRIKHTDTFDNFIELETDFQDSLKRNVYIINNDKLPFNSENTIEWKDICYVSVGLVLQAEEKEYKGEFIKEDLISDIKDDVHSKPYIEAKWIKKYLIQKNKFLEWNTERVPSKIRRPTFPELYKNEKILLGGLTGGVFDDSDIICNHSCFVSVLWKDLSEVQNLSINNSVRKDFKVKGDKNALRRFRKNLEKNSNNYNLIYLLSILNSKFGFYFLNSVRRSQIGFYPDDLKQLPIKTIPESAQLPFITLVNQILEGKKSGQNTSSLEHQIDVMVYHLYKLSYAEACVIDGGLSMEDFERYKI